MKIDILLGLQWGDEGKGKIVDALTPQYDIVARFQGGPNAGHTIEFLGAKHVLHLIPSGIFHNDKINIIGNGLVVDPVVFRREVESLGIDISIVRSRLLISLKAHLSNAYSQTAGCSTGGISGVRRRSVPHSGG